MSRNLCKTECDQCGGVVQTVEPPRNLTVEDAGVYFNELRGLIVANAECTVCAARYIAWLDGSNRTGYIPNYGIDRSPEPQRNDNLYMIKDLSYRSSFNDEPGDDDTPIQNVLNG